MPRAAGRARRGDGACASRSHAPIMPNTASEWVTARTVSPSPLAASANARPKQSSDECGPDRQEARQRAGRTGRDPEESDREREIEGRQVLGVLFASEQRRDRDQDLDHGNRDEREPEPERPRGRRRGRLRGRVQDRGGEIGHRFRGGDAHQPVGGGGVGGERPARGAAHERAAASAVPRRAWSRRRGKRSRACARPSNPCCKSRSPVCPEFRRPPTAPGAAPETCTFPARMDELTRELLAAREGDRLAFAAVVRRAQADVWRYCAHLVGRDDADDLTQETFVRVVRALPAFRGEATARTWLLAIARRACADAVRRNVRVRRRDAAAGSSAADLVAPDASPHAIVDSLLAELDADQRPRSCSPSCTASPTRRPRSCAACRSARSARVSHGARHGIGRRASVARRRGLTVVSRARTSADTPRRA